MAVRIDFAPIQKFKVFLDLIRFEHTIFALPFAYSGMILAAQGHPTLKQFLWITVAMASARTAAMAFNRYADRKLDARNPRTARRPIQLGLISPALVLLYGLVSLGLLALAAFQLNPLVFKLWPGAFAMLALYSYTKRFTWTCHYFLGATDALAPMGAWAAVTASLTAPEDLPIWLLSAGVMVWIAGFDMLYALQDIEVDRKEGLRSIPARFGVRPSLWISRVSHGAAVAFFASAGFSAGLGFLFWIGMAAVCGLFVWQHRLVKPDDISRIDVAFFNVNSYISLTLFAAILGGIYLN